jgi:hypothetical protein
MRRIATLLEVLLAAGLLVVALYMLHEGTSTKSDSASAILIGGAVCFTLSAMMLVSAIRSILWHRRMLRHSMRNHGLHGAAPERNRG